MKIRFHTSPFLIICFFFLFIGHFFPIIAFSQSVLRNGDYRFLIHRDDGNDIVFKGRVMDSAKKKILYIINGESQMKVDQFSILNDSILIELPFFESSFITAIMPDGSLKGQWIKRAAEKERRMPFTALWNQKDRFDVLKKTKYQVGGRWSANISSGENNYDAVGEFHQKGNRVSGTFLTPYGDYRYLEGAIKEDSLYLSGFDGGYALLFVGFIKNKKEITDGKFYSANLAPETWRAEKNKNASLPDAYSLTKIKPNAPRFQFSYPDLDSNIVSSNDERFKNKVIVIQILGSWCPNCLDETAFLADNYAHYSSMGVEFVGLAFERTDQFATSIKALKTFREKFNPPYPILIPPVAVSDTLLTEKVFPQLDKIVAYPTSIFIDKNGYIRKVHAGFDGPATGIHFENYKKEFAATLEKLVKE